MISSSMMRCLTAYLSSIDAKSAIYDDSFKLISSEYKDFFEALDIGAVASDPPIKDERIFSVKAGDEKVVLSVTPIFKSKRIIAAYTVIVRSDYYIYKMMNAGAISDYSNFMFEKYMEQISAAVQLNEAVEECVKKGENAEEALKLLKEQNRTLNGIYSEINLNCYAAFAPERNKRINCNITALLSVLCNEAAGCFKEVNRNMTADIDQKNYYAQFDFNLLSVAVSNILHFHLYSSPLESDITLYTQYNDEGYLEIALRSELDENNDRDIKEKVQALYLRDFAHKIICYDCNGEYVLKRCENALESRITLPVSKKNRGSLLTSKNSAYLGLDYRPLHSSLAHIISSEAKALKK